jgi:hypothetical protein
VTRGPELQEGRSHLPRNSCPRCGNGKYHVPGGRSYKRAAGSKNAIFFKDEAAARKAGYERAKR